MPTIRAASLSGLGALARSLALDEDACLRRAGLSHRLLGNPEGLVSLKAVCAVLEDMARTSRRDDIGLLMAAERRVSNLGAVGLLTALQADLRHALDVAFSQRRQLCSGLVIHCEERDGIAVVTFDLLVPGSPSVRQALEQVAGVIVQLARRYLGTQWTPRRVCFRHPPPADMRTHRQVLGWAVEFEHDFNALVFTSAELSTRAPLEDPMLAELAEQHLRTAQAAESAREACLAHIAHLLPLGTVSIDLVAQRMGILRRTLQRRLSEEGVAFSELVQSLREQLLHDHLASPQHKLTAVSGLLGFSSPSAFSRWHRATFGESARSGARRRTDKLAPSAPSPQD